MSGRMIDIARTAIRDAILAGRYRGGERLKEAELAELAGVSRTSVRLALSELSGEGFVELHPNRGAVVIDWTSGDALQHVFDLRVLIEGYGASLAAQNATQAEIAVLVETADAIEALCRPGDAPLDTKAIAELNNHFHLTILRASGNRFVEMAIVAVLRVPMAETTFGRYSAADLQRSNAHHRELIDAIAARDSAWAQSIMHADIRAGKQAIFGRQGPR